MAEIKRSVASTLAAVEGLKTRSWGVAAALLAWALAQLWSANAVRLERLEAVRPPPTSVVASHGVAPVSRSAGLG